MRSSGFCRNCIDLPTQWSSSLILKRLTSEMQIISDTPVYLPNLLLPLKTSSQRPTGRCLTKVATITTIKLKLCVSQSGNQTQDRVNSQSYDD